MTFNLTREEKKYLGLSDQDVKTQEKLGKYSFLYYWRGMV